MNHSHRTGIKSIHLFIVFFLINFITLKSQTKDSIQEILPKLENVKFQEFKINENLTYQYQKPKFFDFITKLPRTFGIAGSSFMKTDNLIWFGASVGATATLIPFDQKITDNGREFGEQIGFNEDHTYGGPLKLYPKDINSGIYRLGNGFTAIFVGAGLLTYGLMKNNYRAIHTSSEIVEGLIASGIIVQPLKRITGRESPFIAEKNGHPGGAWNPFPSFKAYAKDTPNYDAMPSGHLTTLMTTVMILSENYKEIKWIKPVGFGLMGLMGFEMIQSKVHWVSDYPIAIFMGYIIGKSIVKNRITEKVNTVLGDTKTVKPKYNYSFNANQNYTLVGVNATF
jgi:hypothetical protein